jgi:hypothetical protein
MGLKLNRTDQLLAYANDVNLLGDNVDKKKALWPESASELYRWRDRRFSAKLVPTFEDRGCHMVSVTDPHSRILGFLDHGDNIDTINNYTKTL